MKIPAKIGRAFYSIAMIVYGIQQLFYADFRNVQLPAWQTHIPLLYVLAFVTGIALILAGLAIIFEKKGREVSLILGGVFLFLFLFVHIPFEIFGEINSSLHFALWTNALKELALSGGAFVMAGSFAGDISNPLKPVLIKSLEKIIPFGPIFFSITMISFGLMHFMYGDFVSNMVPDIFPDHLFWTYASGALLVSSGTAIILRIRRGVVAMLLSIMLFLWVFLLHIPRAIAEPLASRGNEVSSTFDALAFCGIALVISLSDLRKDMVEIRG